MQPLEIDDQGDIRFRANAIVCKVLERAKAAGLGLNELALMKFSQADRAQFAQLIGYSLTGYHELSTVSDADALAASAAARELDPAAGGCRDAGCPIHCGVAQEGASPG